MPLETASNILQLDALWPLSTDPTNQGEDHLKLIKAVLKAQFPNGIGGLGFNAPVNSTVTELNALMGVTSNVQTQINNIVSTGGQANTSSNVGNVALGLALPKVGLNLPFKSLISGLNVVQTASPTDITTGVGTNGQIILPPASSGTRYCKLANDAGFVSIYECNSVGALIGNPLISFNMSGNALLAFNKVAKIETSALGGITHGAHQARNTPHVALSCASNGSNVVSAGTSTASVTRTGVGTFILNLTTPVTLVSNIMMQITVGTTDAAFTASYTGCVIQDGMTTTSIRFNTYVTATGALGDPAGRIHITLYDLGSA